MAINIDDYRNCLNNMFNI